MKVLSPVTEIQTFWFPDCFHPLNPTCLVACFAHGDGLCLMEVTAATSQSQWGRVSPLPCASHSPAPLTRALWLLFFIRVNPDRAGLASRAVPAEMLAVCKEELTVPGRGGSEQQQHPGGAGRGRQMERGSSAPGALLSHSPRTLRAGNGATR